MEKEIESKRKINFLEFANKIILKFFSQKENWDISKNHDINDKLLKLLIYEIKVNTYFDSSFKFAIILHLFSKEDQTKFFISSNSLTIGNNKFDYFNIEIYPSDKKDEKKEKNLNKNTKIIYIDKINFYGLISLLILNNTYK